MIRLVSGIEIPQLERVFINAKHFNDADVLLHVDILHPDGTVKIIPPKPGICKNTKPILCLHDCPSYLKGSSENSQGLACNQIDIRHFHQVLLLSYVQHQRENEFFIFK